MAIPTHQKIIPPRNGEARLTPVEINDLAQQLPNWKVVHSTDEPRLQRSFKFKDFAEALAFTVRLGALAEENDHHPSILTEWGRVTVDWWTHKIGGLHHNDFIMAARTDELYTK